MRFLKRRFILYLVSAALLAFVTLDTANTAFATLTETGPGSTSATPVTLNGTNKTTTYTLPLSVTNTGTGHNNGWNLTITSTTFTSGLHSLSTTASTINAAPTVTGCGSGCVAPTNSVTYPPLTVPAGSTAPTAVKFFNAAVNTGTGSMTITPTIIIAIPANTFAGTYTSTVTIVITSGP